MPKPTLVRELPNEDKPSVRLMSAGADALSVSELLSVIIGGNEQEALVIADSMLSEFSNLRGLSHATLEELTKFDGSGIASARRIKASIELGRRLVAGSPDERTKIRTPRDVYNLLGPTLREENREHFVVLLLDTKNGVMRSRTVSIGDLSSSIVHPREVFTEAIKYSAASIIAVHNHPSGDPAPSPEDIAVTRRLAEVGELLGIELMDHIILGDARWCSLKEKGLF